MSDLTERNLIMQKTATYNGEENGQTVIFDIFVTGPNDICIKRDYVRKGTSIENGVVHISCDIELKKC